jgi:hypothetical protein
MNMFIFRILRSLVIAGLFAALAVVLPSCSGDSAPEEAKPREAAVEAASGSHAIKALIEVGGKVQELTFTQGGGEAATESVKGLSANPSLGLNDVSITVPQGTVAAATGASAVSNVLRMAFSECQSQQLKACVSDSISATPFARTTAVPNLALLTNNTAFSGAPSCKADQPTADRIPWFYFSDEPRSAAQVVQFEETLVCVGSKLAELAESEKPITWANGLTKLKAEVTAPFTSGGVSYATGNPVIDLPLVPVLKTPAGGTELRSITFQVVQGRDRFLLRDMAMEVLAMVPLVDQFPLRVATTPTSSYMTAGELFRAISSSTNAGTAEQRTAAYNPAGTVINAANALDYYPPLTWVGSSVDTHATARTHFEMESTTLRLAAQLMESLIRSSVQDAYAGALSNLSKMPPAEQGRAFWAESSDGNSIGQIAKVLFGRLGMMTNVSTDRCASSNARDLQFVWRNGIAPKGLVLRGTDVEVFTKKEREIDALLLQSRFVPSATATLQQVREGIRLSTSENISGSLGLTPASFPTSSVGLTLAAKLASFSDDDVRKARDRQASYFQLLSNLPASDPNQWASLSIGGSSTAGGAPLAGRRIAAAFERGAADGDLVVPVQPSFGVKQLAVTRVERSVAARGQRQD